VLLRLFLQLNRTLFSGLGFNDIIDTLALPESGQRRLKKRRLGGWCALVHIHQSRPQFWLRVQGSGFGVYGFGLRVQGLRCKVLGVQFQVSVVRFRVSGMGFRVQGSGFRV
jgi:hypothetical protein